MEFPSAVVFLCGLIFVCFERVYSYPEIIGTLKTIEVVNKEDTTVTFSCTVKNQGPNAVTWSLLNVRVLQSVISTNDSLTKTNTNKYVIDVTSVGDVKTYKLTINQVGLADAGGYLCAVKVRGSNDYPRQLGTLRVVEDCSGDLFRCSEVYRDGRRCISRNWVCDGERDCPHGEDEHENCTATTCEPGRFTCTNRKCIPMSFVCDRDNDCSDGSDETHEACAQKSKQGQQKPGAKELFTCPPNTYHCPATTVCIPISKLCDGTQDCPVHIHQSRISADEGSNCTRDPSTSCNKQHCEYHCKESMLGPLCYCAPGFKPVNTSCTDLDECTALDDACSQQCENTVGSYKCSCTRGYNLAANQQSCKAKPDFKVKQRLIFSDNNIIRIAHMNGTIIRNISTDRISAMNIDFSKGAVCWVTETAKMYCAKVDKPYSQWEVNTSYVLNGVDQVAKDWYSPNWYFTAGDRGMLFVCSLNGQNCKTLLTTNSTSLKGIALVPERGLIFLTEMAKFIDQPILSRMNMDGTGYIQLRNQRLVRPVGITVDYPNSRIYYLDSYQHHIQVMDYDGLNSRTIYDDQLVQHAVGLENFEDYLYVANPQDKNIMRINRRNSNDATILDSNLIRPEFIQVYHHLRQPDSTSSPYSCNPACDHICLPKQTDEGIVGQCHCQDGYQLVDDSKCQLIVNSTFLLYTSTRQQVIRGVSLDGSSEAMFPIQSVKRPLAVDYHFARGVVYFTDSSKDRIGKRSLTGVFSDQQDFISSRIHSCEGIAVDWMGNNIFWTSAHLKTISTAKLDDPDIHKVLINVTNEEDVHVHPKAIVVDPAHGYIYWTNWATLSVSHSEASIQRAHMDGSNRATFLRGSLQWPAGLTTDHENRRLFWTDSFYDRIGYVSLDDQARTRKYISVLNKMISPYGVTYAHNMIYWTEVTGPLLAYDLTTNKTTIILNSKTGSFDVELYDSHSQTGTNDCSINNGGCGDLCLQTPGGAVCACGDGRKVIGDGKNCTADENYVTRSPCLSTEFHCDNGKCISKRLTCDGDDDCGDNSDESREKGGKCEDFSCGNESFSCSNNRCIRLSWMCDGENDCRDGDDELPKYCQNSTCSPDHFRCNESGQCIPKIWQCDHENDCGNNSDEMDCNYSTCSIMQFTCDNQRCTQLAYICDGEDDCGDKSDEKDCEYTCDESIHFQCETGRHCIPNIKRCDGEDNCGDGSDERNCSTTSTACDSETQFRCDDKCIPIRWKCDHDHDCDDGSDENERDCGKTCNASKEFACDNSSYCIPNNWRCDGHHDCFDRTDEVGCEGACPYPNFRCNSSSTCVNVTQLCDGFDDCPDGSDEGGRCGLETCDSHECGQYCGKSPDTGILCYCKANFKLNSDNLTCIPMDTCDKWGICSQNCALAPGHDEHHMCFCNPGYELDDDRFTCLPKDNSHVYLLFSNRHEIRRFDVKTGEFITLESALHNTIALDYHDKEQLIFWTDVVDDKIYRGKLTSNLIVNKEAVVNVGLATTEGLAIDWVGNNIYWIESNLDQIEVAKLDGSNRTTLIAGDIENPRAIAVDPRVGMLFWTDWESTRPRIEGCSMSGDKTTRYTVKNVASIPDAGWPNGLTLDYDAKRIYWIDARSDSIHTIKYDATDYREVMRGYEFLSHPFAITVFGSYIYWTDWRTNSVIKANKWNGTDVKAIQRTITQPFDVQVMHPLRQPQVSPNPCANNGQCSHLCLLHGTSSDGVTRKCECPHLMRLADDGKTCIENEKFLLFARQNEIRGVDLINSDFSVIPSFTAPHVDKPTTIDYDHEAKKLYWTDLTLNVINAAWLNGTGLETIVDTGITMPSSFAIDWVSSNMYVTSTDGDNTQLLVSKLNGAFRTRLRSDRGLSKPTSIALYPEIGRLYISNQEPHIIYVMDMAGKKRSPLINNSTFVHSPSSLAIDYTDKRLYWINTNKDAVHKIVSCDILTGEGARSFNPVNMAFNNPTALTVYQDTIYLADENGLHSVPKSGGNQTVLKQGNLYVNSMKVYDGDVRKQATSACRDNNGGCSQLCLPIGSNTPICKCTDGYQLDSDSKTCKGVDSFLMYSLDTTIKGITLDGSKSTALPPISKISMATSIDFNAATDYIYWVDSSQRTLNCIKRDLTGRQTIIGDALSGVEGIAVDWVAGNIYWTDQGHDTVEVAKLDGSYRYVLAAGNMDKPRAIVVHPGTGFMYWADWGIPPKIEFARLDGSERKILLDTKGEDSILKDPSLNRPYGLTLDYDNNLLYFCDRSKNTIEKIDLNTNTTMDVLNTTIMDCMSLTVFGDYIYWVDMTYKKGSVNRVNRHDGSDIRTILESVGSSIKDIKIFDALRQKVSNPCNKDNGGCQELCLYNGQSVVCKCAHGRVTEDGKSCRDYDEFLMYSKINAIESMHMFNVSDLNTPKPAISKESRMKNVIGLSFDYSTNRVFFSDIQLSNIQSVFFNGTGFKTLVNETGSVEGLAYEQVFQELYWTSYTDSSISRVSVATHRANLYNRPLKIVQLTAEDHPRALVVDSCHSHMYWTNWNDKRPSIQRAFLGGYDIKDIINTNIRTPNGLTIDHKAQKLYWSDARLDKIERCDFNGLNRVIILKSVPQHVFSMAVYGDYIYWTDWILRAVVRANKYDGSGVTRIKPQIDKQPMGLVAIANDTDNCELNPCHHHNGGCQHICKVDTYGLVSCECFEGSSLLPDQQRCGDNTTVCKDDEFACSTGLCISYELTCNGIMNCPDSYNESNTVHPSSDEDPAFCANRECPTGFFACFNNRCIKANKHCNGLNECGDNSDERGCVCDNEHEFRCDNGMCIPVRYRCDQDPDCTDISDEKNCPNGTVDCTHHLVEGAKVEGLIPCETTTACILPSWRCDGQNDCWDKSDEEGCTTPAQTDTCSEYQFRCLGDGSCIPHTWECDHEPDCADESDEGVLNCNYTCPIDSQFMCVNDSKCIPETWTCDGHFDCSDGSDEAGCENRTCDTNEFVCKTTGRCIPEAWLCDGDDDCGDNTDERGNLRCNITHCLPDEFQCLNYMCIQKSFYCDHDNDCGDGSDEPVETCEYKTCSPLEFRCASGHCIADHLRCDGMPDCPDGSDESKENCTTKPVSPCGEGKFLCDGGSCINETQTCDSHNDCGDNSDEDMCGINECQEVADLCKEYDPKVKCIDLKVGYRCVCPPGKKLNENSTHCEDIDECASYPCTHYCVNLPGTYRCTCAPHYRLEKDKKTCKAFNTSQPYLILANRYYIRKISFRGDRSLLSNHTENVVAVDFDWLEQRIYWSDVTNTKSQISSMAFDGTDVKVLHHTTVKNPDGLAIDWVGRNLYWCDKTTDTIEVSKLDGSYRRVLVDTGLSKPRSIEVHPARGYLFYTDWGEEPHIGRMGMDGAGRQNITTHNLGWPNALTIDYVTDHIFWADARLNYIAMANLNGSKVTIIISGNLPHIFAMTTFEDYIFWTDWEQKNIQRASKFTGNNRTAVTSLIHRPMDIHVVHPFRQVPVMPSKNPCHLNGGCGNLCLIKAGGKMRTCACPENHYLAPDKKQCIANCTSSQFQCASTFKCIPFWWKCDNRDDCGDGSDELNNCGANYRCEQPGLFQCNGTGTQKLCLAPEKICDGSTDCTDGSDERKCNAHTCMSNQFKCPAHNEQHAHCIPGSKRCDGSETPDCPGGEDEENCPEVSCAKHQFSCDNKRCIPLVWRCDQDNDCGDGTDEKNCESVSCPNLYMRCKESGRCIPLTWKCDGDFDCGMTDKSDEPPGCENLNCTDETYFRCKNGRCIPGRWKCDFDDDCHDGSDEENCKPRNCSVNEFRCSDGRCIGPGLKCDGKLDCSDGSDERGCTERACNASYEFKCQHSGYCIPLRWKCDGVGDCTDSSDEQDCQNVVCRRDEFKCNNSLCKPLSWRCDGRDDCGDMSDEGDFCLNDTCPPGRFRCNNRRVCIPSAFQCDGINHCEDNSDEEGCTTSKECLDTDFQCVKTLECISMGRVCDGVEDCSDQSDEKSTMCDKVLQSNCSVNKGGCAHKCELLPFGGTKCLCHQGYKLMADGYNCEDINECLIWGTCDQRCENKFVKVNQTGHNQPGYWCRCDEGFILVEHANSTNTSCVQDGRQDAGTESYIILEIGRTLQAVDLEGSRSDQLFKADEESAPFHVMGMTSDMTADMPYIYLTNKASKKIQRLTVPNFLPSKRRYNRTARSVSDFVNPRLYTLNISGIEDPRGIVYDWVNHNLYWTDAARIMMASVKTLKVTTILSSNLDQPHAIALDPESSKIFWTDWGVNPRIGVASLDGSDSEVLVSSYILWPTSLAVDYRNRRLYWSDAKAGRIETVNIDGTDRRLVKLFNAADSFMPMMVDIFNDKLIYSTQSNGTYMMSKFGGKSTLLFPNSGQIGALVLVQDNKQKDYSNDSASNACNDDPCHSSAICVAMLNQGNNISPYNYICICPDKTVWDGAKCVKDAVVHPTCASNPCLHGGSCHTNERHDIKCTCLDGYSGNLCQTDQCMNYCLNNGTCHRSGGSVSCTCPPGFTGSRCETYRCLNYCYNNGYCAIDPEGKLKCYCNYNYKGDRCETKKKDVCENHCHNSGLCIPILDQPHCRCLPFYDGPRCEKCRYKDHQTVCLNGGICHSPARHPTIQICQCLGQYDPRTNCASLKCYGYCPAGAKCRLDADRKRECYCAKNYCQNGGVCHANSTAITCECVNGWSGRNCTKSSSCTNFGCQNGATCKEDASKAPVCHCASGYSGALCELSVCSNYTCANNGACVIKNGSPTCQCTALWEGENCTVSSPCRTHCFNGGSCIGCDAKSGTCSSCNCPDTWSGDRCQTFVPGGTGKSTANVAGMATAIIIPIVLCILVAIVVLAVCLHKRRKGAKQFGHRRMEESNNVEISNPLYLKGDDDEDEAGETEDTPFHDFQPDKSTNFENPMYSLSQETGSIEKKQLLDDD